MEDTRPIRVMKVTNNGKRVILEDGSTWEILFLDSITSSIWSSFATKVIVRGKEGGLYPYTTVLEMEDSGQKVRAKKI